MKNVIMLIEDNEDIRESAAELLKLYDYGVLEATSGEMALTMINAHNPDLIICDVVMPGIDGYELLTTLRKSGIHIPFILSTAKSEKNDQRKGIELGAAAYLVKPFGEAELLNCIRIGFRSQPENKI